MQAVKKTTITITQCSKTFADGTQALKPINLKVHAGEVLALLGPSGCGKTTLLRIIAGLETANAGASIQFGDEEVTSLSVEQRQVGMVFQHYALFPTMNVESNVGYGLRVRGVSDVERKRQVSELLEMVRLDGMERRRVQELSGGQKQRVALARAIATRPRVLLLDEPLTALDAKLKETLREELAELLRRFGMTAIFVTHDQQEAMAIADRMAVMNKGQIMQLGTAEQIYNHPSDSFVAEFLGQINTINGRATDRGFEVANVVLPIQAASGAERILVRPEHIELGDVSASQLAATVIRRTYLGDKQRLRVTLSDGQVVQVDAAAHRALAPGDKVGLRLDSTRVIRLRQA
jgi:putative spermidine/putrescine transport system ATP-binding protein